MTDNVTESNQTEGASPKPNDDVSSQAGDKQTSSNDLSELEGKLKELITSTVNEDIITEAVNKAVEKAWQSGKDRRIAGLQNEVSKKVGVDEFSTYLDRLAALEAEGMPRKEAMWRMKVEDALFPANPRQEEQQDEVHADASDGTREPQASTVQSSIIKGLGLDPNNADVVKAMREAGSDLISLTTQLSKLAINKAKAKDVPGNEAQVLPTETSGTDTTTLESLQQELASLKQDFTPAAMKRRREINAEIQAQLPKQ